MSVPASSKIISRFLDTVGDGSGTIQMTGDYTTPDSVFFIPTTGQIVVLTRLMVTIRDTGAFDAAKYGNALTPTPGIRLYVKNASSTLYELTDENNPVAINTDWASYCHDATVHSWGTGDEVLSARWTFQKSGQPVILSGTRGEFLELELSGNFTGLNAHCFLVQGHYLRP